LLANALDVALKEIDTGTGSINSIIRTINIVRLKTLYEMANVGTTQNWSMEVFK